MSDSEKIDLLAAWAAQIHDAVASLASHSPGGGRVLLLVERAASTLRRVIEEADNG